MGRWYRLGVTSFVLIGHAVAWTIHPPTLNIFGALLVATNAGILGAVLAAEFFSQPAPHTDVNESTSIAEIFFLRRNAIKLVIRNQMLHLAVAWFASRYDGQEQPPESIRDTIDSVKEGGA